MKKSLLLPLLLPFLCLFLTAPLAEAQLFGRLFAQPPSPAPQQQRTATPVPAQPPDEQQQKKLDETVNKFDAISNQLRWHHDMSVTYNRGLALRVDEMQRSIRQLQHNYSNSSHQRVVSAMPALERDIDTFIEIDRQRPRNRQNMVLEPMAPAGAASAGARPGLFRRGR